MRATEAEEYYATQAELWQAMAGRLPSPMERSTAEALWEAAGRARSGTGRMPTVSAWTAAGKTKSALALAVYLARRGHSIALALPEIDLIEEQYKDLLKVVPAEWIAMQSALHNPKVKPSTVEFYKSRGTVPSAAYTPEQRKAARILLCTHDAWLADVEKGDRWVYRWQDGARDVVIVDEEPKTASVYSFRPSDVAVLRDLLGGTVLAGAEERDFGFAERHRASDALASIYARVAHLMDQSVSLDVIQPIDAVVTEAEEELLANITDRELEKRLAIAREGLTLTEQIDRLDSFKLVIKALRCAASGRVFFGKGGKHGNEGASFFAYDMGLRIPARTICLDGTVDLDQTRAITLDVIHPKGTVQPTYRGSTMHLVKQPVGLAPIMTSQKFNRDIVEAEIFGPLVRYILENSEPGDRVLVYWKRWLSDQTFDGTRPGEQQHAVWQGRTVYFTGFGADKGTNSYKDCNVYVQLGHLYLPRGVYVARLGASSDKPLTAEYLRSLAKPGAKDKKLEAVKTAHLVVRAKQDAARILRNFDEKSGACAPCSLHFISPDISKLRTWANRMFPGIEVLKWGPEVFKEGKRERAQRGQVEAPKRAPGSQRLAEVLTDAATAGERELTISVLLERSGIKKENLAKTMGTRPVLTAVDAGKWQRVALKPQGWKLVR